MKVITWNVNKASLSRDGVWTIEVVPLFRTVG